MSNRIRIVAATLPLAVVLGSVGLAAYSGGGTIQPNLQNPNQRLATTSREPLRITLAGSWTMKESLAEIDRDLVVVVTPVGILGEYWLPMEPEQFVWSRWVVRVDRVLEGDVKAGDEIIVAIHGGHIAADAALSIESGFLSGSLRPEPGEESVLIEYTDLPRLELGRQELLFLKRSETYPEAGPAYLLAAFEGRYLIEDGALRPHPHGLVADTAVARLVASLTIEELKVRLAD